MKAMESMKDNAFDLAIVDPPYGEDDAKETNKSNSKNKAAARKIYSQFENTKPNDYYFNELKRVSKNQIVWGGNFFGLAGGYICWNKFGTAFGEAELAYCSFIKSVMVFEYVWNGMLQDNMKDKEIRIHPTQKPVQLYKWLLKTYAKEGDKILDTHGGSMSIALACHDMKYSLDLWELDEDYYKAGVKRYNQHIRQLQLF